MLTPDSQSPPDSESGGHPTHSLVLQQTVSLPISVKGHLPTDLYNHANTSFTAVQVEGVGPGPQKKAIPVDNPGRAIPERVA